MSTRNDLQVLLAQTEALALHTSTLASAPSLGPDLPLAHYRHIAALCSQGLTAIETHCDKAGTEPAAQPGYDTLLAIARFCMQEHTRICRADEARRERTRRWAEVHDEFEAAQREGRPMRSTWSWGRHDHWQGELP